MNITTIIAQYTRHGALAKQQPADQYARLLDRQRIGYARLQFARVDEARGFLTQLTGDPCPLDYAPAHVPCTIFTFKRITPFLR